jgi:hypothetical protein
VVAFVSDKVKLIQDAFGKGLADRGQRNLYVRCPICAPKDRSKLKLVIKLDDDKVHCWVCSYKARTLAPLLRKFGTQQQFALYCSMFMPEGARRPKVLTTLLDDQPQPLALPKDFRLLATATTRDPDAAAIKRYLQHRGATERDEWYFKLGYSNEHRWFRRAIMPSFDAAGDLNYFTARAIDERRKPKYDNPGCDRASTVFNELNIDWKQPLLLCEGPFDLLKCPDNSVPLLGSELNEQYALFNLIVVHGTPVVLMLDADVRHTKVPRIARLLQQYDIEVRVAEVPADPGSLDKRTVRQLAAAAAPLTWERTFRDRLAKASNVSL